MVTFWRGDKVVPHLAGHGISRRMPRKVTALKIWSAHAHCRQFRGNHEGKSTNERTRRHRRDRGSNHRCGFRDRSFLALDLNMTMIAALLLLAAALGLGGYRAADWLFKVWAGGGMNKL
jgi:hypothetical protein